MSGRADRRGAASRTTTGEVIGVDALGAWLAEQPAQRLRELLADEAGRDPELRRRLTLLAAEGEQGAELTELRRAIEDAFAFATFDGYGFVHYREAWAWRDGVERVLDDLDALLASGSAAQVVDLAESVLTELDGSVGHVDDSDGHLYELFERTMTLHLDACGRARPDPVALAEKLFHWALEFELDRYLGAVGDYAAVLGEDGLAAYRALAEQRWVGAPTLTPGDDVRHGFTDRFRIRTVMESLAAATGGLDELLEVLQRDQASGYAFVRIVQACREHDRDDLALTWAEHGRKAFPNELRLVELICDLHAQAGRHDQALEAARELFARAPSLNAYQRMRSRAQAADRWSDEREAALTGLRETIERRLRETARARSPWQRADGSVLVEILLSEHEIDAPGARPRLTAATARSSCGSPRSAASSIPATRSRSTGATSTAPSSPPTTVPTPRSSGCWSSCDRSTSSSAGRRTSTRW